jgi:hypothetical protein
MIHEKQWGKPKSPNPGSLKLIRFSRAADRSRRTDGIFSCPARHLDTLRRFFRYSRHPVETRRECESEADWHVESRLFLQKLRNSPVPEQRGLTEHARVR